MSVQKPKPVRLYSDGSVYNNGKPEQDAYYCVVLDDDTEDGKLIIEEHIGDHSVNEAEYEGVIAALEWYIDQDIDEHLVVITDSKLVCGHVLHGWTCNLSILKHYRNRVQSLLIITDAKLMWRKRSKNKAGWHFERVVDARRKSRYKIKKEKRRSKRKLVRSITLEARKDKTDDLHKVWEKVKKTRKQNA